MTMEEINRQQLCGNVVRFHGSIAALRSFARNSTDTTYAIPPWQIPDNASTSSESQEPQEPSTSRREGDLR